MKYYLPGITLILAAILIVLVPEILIAFLAALMIMAGIGALYIGHRIRKTDAGFGNSDDRDSGGGPFGWRFARVPVYRRRDRWGE
jgi:hypothetical protein